MRASQKANKKEGARRLWLLARDRLMRMRRLLPRLYRAIARGALRAASKASAARGSHDESNPWDK